MSRARGFTLIELMISMVLGLVIVGSVMGVMLANKKTYRTTEGLSQVQESARTAYELLAHDIRQADGTGCGPGTTTSTNVARTANVLASTALWWQSWFGIRGFDSTQAELPVAVAIGAGVGQRVAGTDSIRVESMDGAGMSIALHAPAAWRLDITTPPTPDFVAGDVMLVCDFDHATIFQVSTVSSVAGTFSVFHDNGDATPPPGNCTRGLDFPTSCATATGNTYSFPQNSQIGRLVATDWYIGNNGRAAEGGRSLYRQRLGIGGVILTEEVVAGVTDMQIQYRATDSATIFASAVPVTDWSVISSVLIQLTAQSGDIAVTTNNAANSGRVSRTYNYLVSLRNRLP